MIPAYVQRLCARRNGQHTSVTVPWGHLYRVQWTGSGFNARTGDYHAAVTRVQWIAFDPAGHLIANADRKRDAVQALNEERADPGLHASSWVTTWVPDTTVTA